MTVLAIETATSAAAAALADENGLSAAVELRAGRRHAELLHVAIDTMLHETGITLSDVGGIAVDVGPGLFTGIRVGVAAAKGFAMALGVPVVGLTSLRILQLGCEAAGQSGAVGVVDLRRGELAWCLPSSSPDALAARHGPPEDLIADLSAYLGGRDGPGPLLLAGDGALRSATALSAALGERIRFAGRQLAVPPVASLALQAVAELADGGGLDPVEVAPVYLRDADVRINWTTRHGAPGRREGVA
ncbi:MAG: tRNA (adenosine(37)-N6)-threonylcarbamoyltransferase complex dimerization subunit type 1 TsaB [Acidimicrobiales bacterium]|jgi:tRNA threonylcarbamoyladenosine biosynthesis protein TsaB